MKQIFLAVLVFISLSANSQTMQLNNAYGILYKGTGGSQALMIPGDTTIRANDSIYVHIASKSGTGRAFFFDKTFSNKWIELQVVGDTSNNYPTSLSYSTDILTLGRQGLSNLTATIPLSTKLNTGDTAAMLANYAKNSQIANLTTVVNNIQTTQDNTVFTNGLLKTGNQVVALYQQSIWNAGQLQGYNIAATAPTDGQVLKWVAANNRYEPGAASGSVDLSNYYTKTQSDARYLQTEADAIALAALIDTAAAIRAAMGSGGGGGSTPGIDDVLTSGYSLAGSRQIDASGGHALNVFLNHDATWGDSYFYFDDADPLFAPRFGGVIVSTDTVNTIGVDKTGISIRSQTSGLSTGVNVKLYGIDIFYKTSDLYLEDGEMGMSANLFYLDPSNTGSFHPGYVLTDVNGIGYVTWESPRPLIFTPSTSIDSTHPIKTLSADDTFLYFRTSSGTWKKIAWTTF